MPSKYKLKLQRDDGTIKEVPWNRDDDPTPEEIETLLSLPDPPDPSKAGLFSQQTLSDILGEAKELGGSMLQLGKDMLWSSPAPGSRWLSKSGQGYVEGVKHGISQTKKAIDSPTFSDRPLIKGAEVLATGAAILPDLLGLPIRGTGEAFAEGRPGKALVRGALSFAGAKGMQPSKVPAMKAPKIDLKGMPPLVPHGPFDVMPLVKHGPEPQTPFESLSKIPEQPKINWDLEHQAGLPLEYNDLAIQDNLPQAPKSAGNIGHLDALVPDRYKTAPPEYPSVTGPRQPELFPNPAPDTPIILEPKLFDFERPTWSKYAEQRELPLEFDLLSEAEVSGIPEIQRAAQQVVQEAVTKSDNSGRPSGGGSGGNVIQFNRKTGYSNPNPKISNARRALEDWIKSNYKVLVEDSPAGRGIASMIDKFRSETGRTSGEISARIREVVEPLNKEQYAQFQQLLDTGEDIAPQPKITVENVNVGRNPKVSPSAKGMEGITNAEILSNLKEPPLDTPTASLPPEFSHMQQPDPTYVAQIDPMVRLALDVVRDIDNKFTERVKASGLHLKTSTGELLPFTGKEHYWPRMYDPSLFADKPALLARLIKQGMAPEAAKKAVDNSRRFGERLIDPQNQRVLDLPEHRKDLGALLKHYDDMAHRVVGSEVFGVKDIADPNTPISQLVANTKDPSRVTKILTEYLDRESGVAAYEADLVKKVTKFTTAYYLSKFALTNSNQLAFVPVVTNFTSTAKALKTFIKNPRKAWSEAEGMGALQTVLQESMREVGGESFISKAYLIKASEGANRTISAIAGKHYVTDLFNKFQRNPGNVKLRKTLEDLTLTNADDLLAQGALNDKQIAYAGTRVAEKTQGRAQSIDLPYNWDKSPYMNLLLLYKKFAFVQGRLIKSALKNDDSLPFISKDGGVNINPRNAALLAGLFQMSGEATGDAKAAIKGMFSGNIPEQVKARGEHLGMNGPMNRIVQNYIDSMFLGLLGEVAQSVRGGKQSMYNTVGGPVIGGVIDVAGNVGSDLGNLPAVSKNPKKSNTLKGLASRVPYVGSALRESLK